jgi:hypothetical protein
MGDLVRVGRSIRHCFVKEDGHRFYGQLLKPPMSQTRTSSFFNPRRILKVDQNQNIENGEVFKLLDGEWGLTFDNTEGYYRDVIYRTFGVIVVDSNLTWKRRISEIDPLTKLEKTVGYEDLGKLKCSMEFMSYTDDSLKIPQPRYRLLCGKEILPGDVLDDKITVQHVERMAGITMAYVRGVNIGRGQN